MNSLGPVGLKDFFFVKFHFCFSVELMLVFIKFKNVRAHRYCASLVRTLHMTWRVPRHVFQALHLVENSTKYRVDDLCGNVICEFFCWMVSDPPFFLADHFLF